MENNELVSVIVPVYNVGPYLVEALDCVCEQTYDNLEIIVVDDGSTDGSGAICDRYAEKDGRVQVVHQERKGLSGARNTGLERMTGTYVAFLDSDDAFVKTFIETMVNAMRDTQADMAVSRFAHIRTDGKLIGDGIAADEKTVARKLLNRADALRALADNRIDVIMTDKLYRRELWDTIRFPEGYVHEDVAVIFSVFDLCSSVCVLDSCMYFHRLRPDSIIGTLTKRKIRDRIRATALFNGYVEDHVPDIFPEEQLRRCRQSALNGLIGVYVAYSRGEGEGVRRFADKLRRKILTDGRKYGIKNFRLRTRIAYRMLLVWPGLLRRIGGVYLRLRGERYRVENED